MLLSARFTEFRAVELSSARRRISTGRGASVTKLVTIVVLWRGRARARTGNGFRDGIFDQLARRRSSSVRRVQISASYRDVNERQ